MITLDLRDKNLVENFKAIQDLRKREIFTDEAIQEMYDMQIALDRKEEEKHERNLI